MTFDSPTRRRQNSYGSRPHFLMLVLLASGSAAIGADYHISTQAEFDAYRQATFSPGDNIFFVHRHVRSYRRGRAGECDHDIYIWERTEAGD